jgi:CHAD domain-containing protein
MAGRVARLGREVRRDPVLHHELRIAIKRLRYALDALAPLYRGRQVRKYLGAAAAMQETLGELNDIHVAQTLLAELRLRQANDLLQGWLAGRAELLLDRLPAAIDRFVRAPAPWQKTRK